MTVQHIVPLLNVEDVQRSIDFYSQTLGFSVDDQWSPQDKVLWARISSGPVALMLNGRESKEAEHRRARSGHHDVVIYLGVEDVVSLHSSLKAQGHEPSTIEDETYGVRQFGLRDPDGYELALTSPLDPGE